MCRNNEHGGRRCPAHTDPVRIAAYNAVRRARYQARKQGGEHATAAVFDITKIRTAPTGVELNKHQATTAAFEAALTHEEKQALIDYTEFDYEDIRDMLTGFHVKTQQPLSFDEEEQARIKQQIEHIDTALAKNQNKLPRRLYRGMRINRHIADPSAWVQENFKPGSTFSQPGYMSTSLSPFKAAEFGATVMDDGSRGIIIEILSKEGAVLGDQSSSFGFGEQEVLIPRGHEFEVVAVHERVEFKYDYFADDEGFDDLDDDEPFSVTKTVIQVIDKQAR